MHLSSVNYDFSAIFDEALLKFAEFRRLADFYNSKETLNAFKKFATRKPAGILAGSARGILEGLRFSAFAGLLLQACQISRVG